MKRDDIEKLLGAYATGTLTAEERAALYEAALADQALYDALSREEPLRELFEDPVARARLLAVLSGRPAGFAARLGARFRRPAPWAMAGGLAAAGLIAFFALTPRPPAAVPLAQMELKSVPLPAPVTAPVTAKEEVKTLARLPARRRRMEDLPKQVGLGGMPSPPMADARAGFREMERAEAPAWASSLAVTPLAYRVLRQSGDQFAEAAPGAVFDSGDVVRLAVVPPADGHLVVTSDPGVEIYSAGVEKGARVVVPATGGIVLGPGAGAKTVRLAFSADAASKGARKMLPMRDASANEIPKPVAPAAPITVDVVLQFR
jgi:hypothetical protein